MSPNSYNPTYTLQPTAVEDITRSNISRALSNAIVKVVHPVIARSRPLGMVHITVDGSMLKRPERSIADLVHEMSMYDVELVVDIKSGRQHVVKFKASDSVVANVTYNSENDTFVISAISTQVNVFEGNKS